MAFGSHSLIHSFLLPFNEIGCVPTPADTVVKDLEFQLVEETNNNHRVKEDSFP